MRTDSGEERGRGFNSAYGNRTGVLGDALGWCRGLGRTGRIASNRGRIPHRSAGVRSCRKALSYIGLAQGSTPPPILKPQLLSVGAFFCLFAPVPVFCDRNCDSGSSQGAHIMTGIGGLAGRFQSYPLAGADNQYTHDGPFISKSMPPTLLQPGKRCSSRLRRSTGSPLPGSGCRPMVGRQMTRSDSASALV